MTEEKPPLHDALATLLWPAIGGLFAIILLGTTLLDTVAPHKSPVDPLSPEDRETAEYVEEHYDELMEEYKRKQRAERVDRILKALEDSGND